MAYLSKFHHIRPNFHASQQETLEFLANCHVKAEGKSKNWEENSPEKDAFYEKVRDRLFYIGLAKSKIASRGAQVHATVEANCMSNLNEKMDFFSKETASIFEKFYPEKSEISPHLIHVTCTGYVAPSGAQRLIANRNLGDKVSIIHAYHMGCYASLPAIRMAVNELHQSKEPTDIVHTEMCSLHMNPYLHNSEQLVVQSLFADGFIKYVVQEKPDKAGLKVVALWEEIIPESLDKMTWQPNENGFYLTIDKAVPSLFMNCLERFLEKLFKKGKMNTVDRTNFLFAIHPGGPKIIEEIEKKLGLSAGQTVHSKAILEKYGNMSSATLPHIWESMLNDPNVLQGTMIVSLAFGPGLTVWGGIFQKV
ncbi:MAG: hypothetical protein L0207_02550 [Chlamydiae bacterium]|nr:hypothetical protein [Chlamydiota bacterium]